MKQIELFANEGAAATPKRRQSRQKQAAEATSLATRTLDSFQNFALNLGLGTDNALTGSTYGFNPVTRIRTLLEWIYRGSWMGAVAIDIVADDMTRAGVEVHDVNLDPEQIDDIHREATRTGVWSALNDTEKWARLYGGCLGVLMIDGQDMSTPLRVDTIRPGQFRGILPVDRWMCTPSSYIVNEMGPSMGQPVSYQVDENAPGFRGMTIHHSRVIRLVGIELPWNQRISENLWGLSIIERIYDRMVAFDSATQGAAQLIYKIATRTYKVKNMRQILAMGGGADQVLFKYADMVRKFQSIEGMTLIDAEDDLVTETMNVQSGISDALLQFAQQLAGALQIPLTRMLGQSPAGLNATGESDLRTYYDGIANQQNKELLEPVTTVYRVLAASKGIKVGPKFGIKFRPLWQMSEVQKSEVAERDARTIGDLLGTNVYDRPTALKDLRQLGGATDRFQNITDEMIAQAEKDQALLPPPGAEEVLNAGPGEADNDNESNAEKRERRAKASDAMPLRDFAGLQLVIETPAGTERRGRDWVVTMPADYGYIRGTSSAEGKFEQMDCFVGKVEDATLAYVVDAQTPEGEFDEHKVMLGFPSQTAAETAFRAAYHDSRSPMAVTAMTVPELSRWMENYDVTVPLSRSGFIRRPYKVVG